MGVAYLEGSIVLCATLWCSKHWKLRSVRLAVALLCRVRRLPGECAATYTSDDR